MANLVKIGTKFINVNFIKDQVKKNFMSLA